MEDEFLYILPTHKGFESPAGHLDITITPEILKQVENGKILFIDIGDDYR